MKALSSSALPAAFFLRGAEEVARELLGHYLISLVGGLRCAGRIVETEAYPGPHDPASHAATRIGRTARNEPMFGPPGSAYIHQNYGIHWCLNAVVEREGFPAAVLIRALEPTEGLQTMRKRRDRQATKELCSGPARLTQALAIGPDLQRHPLHRQPVVLAKGEPVPEGEVVQTTRIGIRKGADRPWRFYHRGNPHVSRRSR